LSTELQHKSDTGANAADNGNLPAGSKLYYRQGVPQLFKSIGAENNEGEWLYLPQAELDRAALEQTRAVSNAGSYRIGLTGTELDDFMLYPISYHDALIAFLQTAREVDIDTAVESLPADCPSHQSHQSRGRNCELAGIFVRTLFQRDNNLATVLRKTLDLVAGQCEGSYVGLYNISPNGEWNLRMAVGDIHLSDRLPNRPTGTRMTEWSHYAAEGGKLVPSDTTPEFPVLLRHAPTFLHIAPGPSAYRSKFVLVTAIPGTATVAEVEAVQASASLLKSLDETQFTSTSNLLGLFSELTELQNDEDYLAPQLAELYRILDQELTVERLALISAKEPAIVVYRDDERKVQTIECANYRIPTDLWTFTKEQPLGITCGAGHPLTTIENRYGDVAVERTFRIKGPKEADFLFAVGTAHDNSQLERASRILMTAARYLTMLLKQIYSDSSPGSALVAGRKSEDPERVVERVRILRKLSDGMFHGLFGSMSVVVGQSELLAGMAAGEIDSNKQLESIPKIIDAANETAERLTRLRKIFGYDQIGSSGSLTAADLVVELPGLLEGFLRKIKDTRNITVSVEFDSYSDSEYSTTSESAIEYLLKFIAAVMEEAICSGTIAFRFEDARSLSIQIPRSMIEHIEAVDFLQHLYPYDRYEPRHEGGMIESDRMRVTADLSDDGYISFTFENCRLAGRKFDADAPKLGESAR